MILMLMTVNATALLTALGLKPAQVTARLQQPSPWTQNRHINSSICAQSGILHSNGVAGVWVQYVEALELVKPFKADEARFLSTILKEDLFQMVSDSALPLHVELTIVCHLGEYQTGACHCGEVWAAGECPMSNQVNQC